MSLQPDPLNTATSAEAVDADGRPLVFEPPVATPEGAVVEPAVVTPVAPVAAVAEPAVFTPVAPVAAVAEPAVVSPVAAVTPVPVVERVVVQAPAAHQTVATSYGRHYALDSVVVGLVGLFFLVLGLIALTRAGVDGSMKDPVVKVLGFTHTATLGIIEAGIGLCLLLAAATMSRGASMFFGLLLGVGGFVGAVQVDSFKSALALETGLAWIAVIAAVIVVAASLLIPRMVTRTNRVEAI